MKKRSLNTAVNISLCIFLTVAAFFVVKLLKNDGKNNFISSDNTSEMESFYDGQSSDLSRDNESVADYSSEKNKEDSQTKSSSKEKSQNKNESKTPNPPVISEETEINGVWIASVGNIDFPSKKGLSAKQMKKELDEIVDNVKKLGMNTIIFQVRPASDALYKSEIFPVSEYIAEKQGNPLPEDFDPLSYIIERAHQKGLFLHAWINPYRITTGTKASPRHDLSALAKNNPARLNPQWTVPYADGKLYYNPGLPEVRQLVISGVMEIVKNYDVDGIHFDDYFYPYPVENAVFDDSAAHEQYGKSKTIDAFRRDSVNTLIKDVYTAVKKEKPKVLFGVSPFGIWANSSTNKAGSDTRGFESYTRQFADSYTWVKNEWLDYISPQIYWSMEYSPARFDILCDWWSGVVKGTKVKFVPGHGAYKAGDKAQIAVDSSWSQPDEILRQISYAKHKNGYSGSLFYGYRNIKANVQNLYDNLSSYYNSKSPVVFFPAKGIILANAYDEKTTDKENIHLFGAAPPKEALLLNGKKTDTDKYGFFSVFLPLLKGENTFIFKSGQTSLTHRITRIPAAETKLLNKESIFPKGEGVYYDEDNIWVSVSAEKESVVTAKIWKKTTPFFYMGGGIYGANLKLPKDYGKNPSLERVYITAQKDGKTETAAGGVIRTCFEKTLSAVVAVKTADAVTAFGIETEDDSVLFPKGTADDIIAEDSGYAVFSCGYFVKKEDLAFSLCDEKTKYPLVNNVGKGEITDAGNKTVFSLDMSIQVPFFLHESKDGVKLVLCHTKNEGEAKINISQNIMFNGVTQAGEDGGTSYFLRYAKGAVFSGYKAWYENGRLVAEFYHPPAKGPQKSPLAGTVIALDPGHGGNRGAVGPFWHYGPIEDDLNLDMAYHVKESLESMGAAVYMTRTKPGTLHSVKDVAEMYRNVFPHLALSIHFNSMNRNINGLFCMGSMAFYNTSFSKAAAEYILESLQKNAGRPIMKPQKASFAVICPKEFPSLLLELGFMNNISEYGWFLEKANRIKTADAVAKGICIYFERTAKTM